MMEYKTTQTTTLCVDNDSNDIAMVEITVMIDGRPNKVYILLPYDELLGMVTNVCQS